MLPIENSLAGLVPDTLAILEEGARLGRRRGRAAHPAPAWSAPAGATLDDVRAVHSHPMALAQCRNALNGRYERVAASTTSEAARTVAELDDLDGGRDREPARGAQHTASTILADEISDHPENLTRFVALARFTRLDHDAPHRLAHGAAPDHEARAGRAALRDRAAALPRRADDVAALAADHGRALALPVLHRRRRPPLGRARAARAQATSPTAAPSCTCWARIPSAAGCGERCRCGGAARARPPRAGRAVVRPPERRSGAGHGARPDPVHGRRARLQLRRGGRAAALLEHRLVVPAAAARRVRRSHQRELDDVGRARSWPRAASRSQGSSTTTSRPAARSSSRRSAWRCTTPRPCASRATSRSRAGARARA